MFSLLTLSFGGIIGQNKSYRNRVYTLILKSLQLLSESKRKVVGEVKQLGSGDHSHRNMLL